MLHNKSVNPSGGLGGSFKLRFLAAAGLPWSFGGTTRINMPALKDEMVFNVDGFVPVDPALGLRERAQRFVASRQWATPSIYYGDQPEPADPDFTDAKASWSMCLCLGLDHVRGAQADWFADVAAIVEFVRSVALEAGCEFTVEFRLSSRLWYSETLDIVTDAPHEQPDLPAIRSMLVHFTRQQRSWWRRLIGA